MRARPAKADPTPLDIAAGWLKRGALSETALHARLVAKGYRPATAAATVARCRELGWVGDEHLAADRARTLRQRGAGPLKIAADLAGRGVPERLVESVVEASREGESEAWWARRALEHQPQRRGASAWRLLAARGFPDDVLADVVGDPGDG